MTLPEDFRGKLLAVGLAVLALLAVYVAAVAPALDAFAAREETLSLDRARASRIAQITATLPDLRRAAAAVASDAPAAVTVLAGTSDALAGAELQGRVQEIAQAAGATISSLETLPAEPRGAYRRVALRIAFAGPWPVVVRMLGGIADASPKMLVDEVQLRGSPMRPRPAGSAVDASMVVIAFRAGT